MRESVWAGMDKACCLGLVFKSDLIISVVEALCFPRKQQSQEDK
jgi:hypothetical protein